MNEFLDLDAVGLTDALAAVTDAGASLPADELVNVTAGLELPELALPADVGTADTGLDVAAGGDTAPEAAEGGAGLPVPVPDSDESTAELAVVDPFLSALTAGTEHQAFGSIVLESPFAPGYWA